MVYKSSPCMPRLRNRCGQPPFELISLRDSRRGHSRHGSACLGGSKIVFASRFPPRPLEAKATYAAADLHADKSSKMTITEREGFGAYGQGIRPNEVPRTPYGPDHPKLGDGKSEFDAKHHQGRTVIGTQEGVITRATRALRPITAASHGCLLYTSPSPRDS